MRTVWFIFKLLESTIGLVCMAIHIKGFLYDPEPLPHHMYFCGTYFGFTFISLFGLIGVFVGSHAPLIVEIVVSACGGFYFIVTSIFSMYHVERDFHLMYLSDVEESHHPFFYISKMQSIMSLVCGMLYMMHCILALDAYLITDENYESPVHSDVNDEANEPIELDLFCWTILAKFECSRGLANALRGYGKEVLDERRKRTQSNRQNDILIV